MSNNSPNVIRVDTFEVIRNRRSYGRLFEPAPTKEELQALFEAAACAPDHKQLRPWRFIVLEGANKKSFSDHLVNALLKREPAATEGQIEKERTKLDRAPLVIVVACKKIATTLPLEELQAATAAATQNLLLAAGDLGYGTMWRTGDAAYDPNIKSALGLDQQDSITGFIYVGTTAANNQLNPRSVEINDVVSIWGRNESE